MRGHRRMRSAGGPVVHQPVPMSLRYSPAPHRSCSPSGGDATDPRDDDRHTAPARHALPSAPSSALPADRLRKLATPEPEEQRHAEDNLQLGATPIVYKRNYLVRGDELNMQEDDTIDFDVVTGLVFPDRASYLA
jgi:hypothetical protein